MTLLSACAPAIPPAPRADPPVVTPTASSTRAPASAVPLYQDARQPVEVRVNDLLARMTLAEKIGQMTLVDESSIKPADVTDTSIGSLLSGGDGGAGDNRPASWAQMVNVK